MPKSLTTQAIAQALDGKLIGDGNIQITRIAHPTDVTGEHDLAMAMDKTFLPLLAKSAARAAVIANDAELEPGLMDACIVVDRPRLAMAKLTNLFFSPVNVPTGIHPTAVIEDGVQLGENVAIGPFVFIASGAAIGANSVLHSHVYIGPDSTIGRDALIYAGVKIGAHVQIGERCIIHFNSSIGADGFSFVTPQLGSVESAKATGEINDATNTELVRIASIGTVVIGDDVEIGANSSVDRGTIAATRIGNGTKIDNQVQVGHNVTIGENCLICGHVGIAGSVQVGNRVVLGGATAVADHIRIGDDAITMGMTGVAGHVLPKTIVGGIPAVPRQRLAENLFYLGRIKHWTKKIEGLGERLKLLEEKEKSG